MTVAIAHDYVTQRGGAERVALSLSRAFPESPMHTTLYDPESTFPEFADIDLLPSALNRWSLLRRNHRLALPFLARTVSGMHIDADVVIASSSGWAHGIPTDGRKIVYCHAPARWLYQTKRYLGFGGPERPVRRAMKRVATSLWGPTLRAWDQRAASSADRYVVNSTAVRDAVREIYGIDAEVLYPPAALMPDVGHVEAVDGIVNPFVLCVARLLPYKNVDAVLEAVAELGSVDLVVVGDGPDRRLLEARAAHYGRTRILGSVSDAQLRWLYAHSIGLVAASYEDFGLSPLEAAAFGKPTAALRAGGFLDTVVSDETGIFFDQPTAGEIGVAVDRLMSHSWDPGAIASHIDSFSEERFIGRIQEIVHEEESLACAR
jgi:glycosyltransferase involved in cell wall biosynthesis